MSTTEVKFDFLDFKSVQIDFDNICTPRNNLYTLELLQNNFK